MFPIHLALLLQGLIMTVCQTFSRWLGSSGVAAVAMRQIVAHALLRRRVARRSLIEGTQWRWQDLEADGLLLLREKVATIPCVQNIHPAFRNPLIESCC